MIGCLCIYNIIFKQLFNKVFYYYDYLIRYKSTKNWYFSSTIDFILLIFKNSKNLTIKHLALFFRSCIYYYKETAV